MFTQFNNRTRLTPIIGLVLVLAISVAWANNTHYSASAIAHKNQKTTFDIRDKGNRKANVVLEKGSIDNYLTEQGVNEVEITVEMVEEEIKEQNGASKYRLTFTFGPSGAYFDPPLILGLTGRYATDLDTVYLVDEYGEAIESTIEDQGISGIKFYIPHFSSYYYDGYDY